MDQSYEGDLLHLAGCSWHTGRGRESTRVYGESLAGAHVYFQSNDVLLADTSIVALHSLKSELEQIDLPGVYDVYDVVTGN